MSDELNAVEPDASRMRAYLLGELSEADRSAVEERFMEDDEYYDCLLEMQNDLIDAYARGDLEADERRRVDERLLRTQSGAQRLQFARALDHRDRAAVTPDSGATPAPRPAASLKERFRWLAAAASLAVVTGAAGWLAVENARLRRTLQFVSAARQPASEATPANPSASAPAAVSPAIRTVTLTPERVRGSQAPTELAIAPNVQVVRISLGISDAFPAFEVAIERRGGRVWSRRGLETTVDGTVDAWLTPDLLSAGDYEILLSGERDGRLELVGVYGLRVVAAKPADRSP